MSGGSTHDYASVDYSAMVDSAEMAALSPPGTALRGSGSSSRVVVGTLGGVSACNIRFRRSEMIFVLVEFNDWVGGFVVASGHGGAGGI